MPLIAELHGIKIYMYWSDHMPPHFHVIKGGEKAIVLIETGEILAGMLSPSTIREVQNWQRHHVSELNDNWSRGQQMLPFFKIGE